MFFEVLTINVLPNQKPCGEPECFPCTLFIHSDFGRFLPSNSFLDTVGKFTLANQTPGRYPPHKSIHQGVTLF